MNKITKEFLESEIIAVEYKRLSERLTHCTITVKNGFQFTGESACVDPTDYNEDIGNKIAYNHAFDKMWLPYGFWLRQKMRDEGAFSNVEAVSKSDDESYQIKDTDQFTLELAIALAQNGDVVRNVNTGTTLSLDDCRHDAFWQLAQASKAESWLDRLQTEHDELAIKVKKLKAFIESDAFNSISPVQATMLEEQLEHMGNYLALLDERIANANDPSFARD